VTFVGVCPTSLDAAVRDRACVSAAAACRSAGGERSHVLAAIGSPDDGATVRFGLGENPESEVRALAACFVEAARRLRPRLIFLASPNNPTGKAFDPAKVDALRGLPGCTLVLDEAYAEFGGRSLLGAAAGEEGLVVLRTFSKAWGLAGLRLGWLCARPDLVAELEKLRLPYNLDAVTQVLGEMALDRAGEFLGRVPALLKQRDRLAACLAGLPGARVYPSDANFALVRLPGSASLHSALLRAGMRTRRFKAGALDGCLRISAGRPEQMERLEAAVAAWSKENP
jgi:histidinol-phosphate aminotransferase